VPTRRKPFIVGEFYHIFNRGVNGSEIFYSERNYYYFLKRIKEIVTPNFGAVICYVLMPTHYHFLIQIKNDDFSSAIARVAISYSKSINKEITRSGPLFDGRFKAIHIDSDEYALSLSHYIHLNPVKAKLVKSPEQWPFSSYLDYIGMRQGALPDKEFLYSYFSVNDSANDYRRFIENYSETPNNKIDHLLLD
jgi:putative transposase